MPSFNDECFVMCPIGDPGSRIRRRSDKVLKDLIEPAVVPLSLRAVRADSFTVPDRLDDEVISHTMQARVGVADLTRANPNVYYELALRHFLQLPAVMIAQKGTKIAFDVAARNTIFVDSN